MSRRRWARLTAVLAPLVLAFGITAACTPSQQASFKAMSPEQQAVVLSLAEPTTTTTTTPPPPSHCADYANMEAGRGHPANQHWFNHLDARGYARVRIACVYGWDTTQWNCLDRIWAGESGWDHRVRDGIPQAKPGSKMANAPGGPDYRTNPRTQVRWGLQYIADRYGVPTKAGRQPPFSPEACDAGY